MRYCELWEFQRCWDVDEGVLSLWSSVAEAGRQAGSCLLRSLLRQRLFDYCVSVTFKPQLQEKLSSFLHLLLVFLGSGTPTTFIMG